MEQAIVGGTIVRPGYRIGPLDVEGPDEDAFTLAVEALEPGREGGRGPGALERLHLVGPTLAAQDWAFREALGRPRLEIHHHRPGAASLFAALSLASQAAAGSGEAAVVAVDVAAPPDGGIRTGGAGAVAFHLSERPGVRVTGFGQRAHPSGRRPNASEWVDAAARVGAGPAPSARGELLLVSERPPPVLSATWTQRFPQIPCRTETMPEHVGRSDGIGAATRLIEMVQRLPTGAHGIVARVEPDWSDFLSVTTGAPVPVEVRSAPERPELPTVGRGGPRLDLVSEGAYVPYATYRENLPSRWRFVASRCPSCQRTTFPERPACRHCGTHEGLVPEPLPIQDLPVEAVTTVRPGAQPTEFDPQVAALGGYDVVLARLAPEVRVTLQVSGCPAGSVRIGDLVDTRLRRLYAMEGEWRYGRKAVGPVRRPAEAPVG